MYVVTHLENGKHTLSPGFENKEFTSSELDKLRALLVSELEIVMFVM